MAEFNIELQAFFNGLDTLKGLVTQLELRTRAAEQAAADYRASIADVTKAQDGVVAERRLRACCQQVADLADEIQRKFGHTRQPSVPTRHPGWPI
jgi:hypothetical protein